MLEYFSNVSHKEDLISRILLSIYTAIESLKGRIRSNQVVCEYHYINLHNNYEKVLETIKGANPC